MATEQKPKQKPARRVVLPPNRPHGKKMPVTVRDPLTRRVVKTR